MFPAVQPRRHVRAPDVVRSPPDSFLPAAIVDGLGIGLIVVDREYRIRQVNEFVAGWVKRDRQSLVGMRCHEVFHRSGEPCADCPCSVTFRTGGSARTTHTGVNAEGGTTYAEISSQPLYDDNGQVAWALESASDVSERVRHELDAAAALSRLKASEEQLLKRNNELEVVNAILAAAGTAFDVHEILKGVLAGALRLAGLSNRGCVFLVDDDRRELRLAVHSGLDEEFLRHEQRVPLGDCLCGEVALSGRVLSSACSTGDVRHTRMRGACSHGHLIVPLKSQEQVLGVMALYLADGFQVSGELERLFGTLGRQVGVALDNAMAYQRTDQHLQRKVVELTRALTSVEQEKARAQANEQAKDQFITMVSHDLRSPLAVITTSASICSEHDDCNDCRQAADAILRAARRMKEMISNVVDSARLE